MWLLLASILSTACSSSLRKSRTDLPAEERGAAELTRMVLDYKAALGKRDFSLAERLLVALEREVGKADPVTQSHPDFDEIQRAAEKARPAFEVAVRRATIDRLIGETQRDLEKGRVWAKNLAEKGPVPRLLDGLGQVLAHLEFLRSEGLPYRDDPRYAEFAKTLDAQLAAHKQLAAEYDWLARLHTAIAPALEQAVSEDKASQEPGELTSRQAAAERAAAGFATCTEQAALFAADPAASASLAWETALGGATLPELQLNCEFRRAAAAERTKQLGWQVSVTAVAAEVDAAIRALRAAANPADRLSSTGKAIDVLLLCQRRLGNVERESGYDGTLALSTLLGRVTAVQLREACAKENEKLAAENPTRHWQSALASLQRRAREARAAARAVPKTAPPRELETSLRAAIAGLDECLEQAKFLLARQAATWRKAKPTPAELKQAKAAAKACAIDERRARAQLEKLTEPAAATKKKRKRRR